VENVANTRFFCKDVGRNRAWDRLDPKLWMIGYDRTVDIHIHPWGLPSHVTLGLCPYIPSFYLSRGGCRFLLLYWVVALMVYRSSASPVLQLSRYTLVNK